MFDAHGTRRFHQKRISHWRALDDGNVRSQARLALHNADRLRLGAKRYIYHAPAVTVADSATGWLCARFIGYLGPQVSFFLISLSNHLFVLKS
jgi:hypothetical protein